MGGGGGGGGGRESAAAAVVPLTWVSVDRGLRLKLCTIVGRLGGFFWV